MLRSTNLLVKRNFNERCFGKIFLSSAHYRTIFSFSSACIRQYNKPLSFKYSANLIWNNSFSSSCRNNSNTAVNTGNNEKKISTNSFQYKSKEQKKDNSSNIDTEKKTSTKTDENKSCILQTMRDIVPKRRQEFALWKKQFGDKIIAENIVAKQALGMRGIKCMIYETSQLDENEGIRFRGLSVQTVLSKLPKAQSGNLSKCKQPLPEGILQLLLTDSIPTIEQVNSLRDELRSRSHIDKHILEQIDSYPSNMHSMTQLSSTLLALQPQSKFAKAYLKREHKLKLWEYALEDSLDIIAKLPQIASRIYRNKQKNNDVIEPNPDLDQAANFAHMLGFDDPQFYELMRLYLTIHCDHEGGNVSAHATRLVGSSLSDPYLSFSSGINGLAGPLHGLANQEVLVWLKQFMQEMGSKEITKDSVSNAVQNTLNKGQVIPGYGHAVLKVTDPRYSCQRDFALEHLPDDPLFKLVGILFEVVPNILTVLGKVSNPQPNVDAHSGVLLNYYGLVEPDFYTVLFAVSRSIGVLSNLTNDRILSMPIERPKSVTTQWVADHSEAQECMD